MSAISLVLFVALGLVLSKLLSDGVDRRARENAVKNANVIAQTGIRHYLTATEMSSGKLTPERIYEMDRDFVANDLAGLGISRIKIFSADPPRVIYSDDAAQIGQDASGAPNVRRALAGETVDHLSRETHQTGTGSQTLSVYVPVRLGTAISPNGVFELYLPYEPIAAAARRETRRIYIALAVGLLILWAALFPLVGSASRTLRRQLADNRHRATHDALTGLANRARLTSRAECILAEGGTAALLLLDLDGFKEINDSLGHEHGDKVLREVAARLSSVMRPADLLARMGGDEFAVLIPDVPSGEAALVVAERLRAALRAPLVLPTLSLRLGVSVGVAVAPEHGTCVDDLMRSADLAMYRAKREMTEIELYRAERDQQLPDRLTLTAELPAAIERGELQLHYQPQVDINTGAPVATEALVRWIHPDRGLIPPDRFVPLAETTGVIADLTRYVLATALAEQARWREAGYDIPVAVNFAGPNVLDVDMPAVVRELVERWETPRGCLIIEISERTVMHGPQRLAGLLDQLREIGVQSSLDDFGTGQSSLAFVRSLPVDEIKIDRSFVFEMLDNAADEAIACSTIALARALGLRVVAEGVEDDATRAALAAGGCHVAQGYLISKPLPADEMLRWLERHPVTSRSADAAEATSTT